MATFEVEVRTTGREIYVVEADSADEAWDNWSDGFLAISEVIDAEVYNVTKEEE